MVKKAIPRFALALCLAVAGLAVLVWLLAGAREQVYAASPQPMGGDLSGRPAPPSDSRTAPAASPPAAPLGAPGSSVITVCDSCPYTTVQQAVSDVASGGVVKVAQGVYTDDDGDDTVVEITKTCTLQGGYTTTNWSTSDPGAYPTILDGGGSAQVVYVAVGVAPTIEGFHIRNGDASAGGGVYVAGGQPVLRRSRVYSNAATSSGAGVYIAGGEPRLENNLVYSNTATSGQGGGVHVAGGAPLLHHNTLYNNRAPTKQGGGIYVAGGTPVVSATIVVSNAASSGGGIYRGGGTLALDYNDVWNNTGGDYEGVSPGPGSISADPLFEDPLGADFRLRAGSPCIDVVPLAQTVALEYRGWVRPIGNQSDVGAYEFYTGTCFARISSGNVYTTVQVAVSTAGAGTLVRVVGLCTGSGDDVVEITRSLTLRGGYTLTNWTDSDPDTCPTILDGKGARRVINIADGVVATVEGFRIYNGNTSGWGAGIRIGSGDSVIQNNWIYSNTTTARGGGVCIAGGSPTFLDNDVYSNTASGSDARGGGIYVAGGTPTIRGNRVSSNTKSGSGYGGGGLYIEGGSALADDNDVYNNTSSNDGGGIYVYWGGATISDNDVSDNTAAVKGGGVFVFNASPTLEDNRIYSNSVNTAGQGSNDWGGGGIFVSSGSPTIRGNAIYGNSLSGINNCGGGIYLSAGGAVVERNDIHNNGTAARGGGIHTLGNVQIRNNLVYGNSATNGGGVSDYTNFAGTSIANNTIYGNTGAGIYISLFFVPVIRNNVVVSNTTYGIQSTGALVVYYNDVAGNASGNYLNVSSTTDITATPQFVDPGVDFRLQSSSPCIDAADPSSYPTTDYDGYARPFGPRADIGAHEAFVGDCFAQIEGASRVYTTVQTAINSATVGSLVKVGGVCQGVVTRTLDGETLSQTAFISQALTLRGGYTLTNWTTPTVQTTLDAQGLGRVVYLTGTSAITVEGFILRGGSAVTGGGLYVATPLNPTIQNVIFYSNAASYGGGLASVGGNPGLYHNTFVTNTAAVSGGGLYIAAGSPAISNTIVVSNASGGIWAASGASPGLAYNDVWGNAGGGYGGDVTTGTTDFAAEPRFVDFAGADFHLQTDSPCLHAGDPGAALDRDFEGDSRPLPPGGGYDVGADESTSYPGIAFAPTGLLAGAIPAQSVVHAHTLTNTGTVTDTFSLSHTLTISGGAAGWSVDYTPVFTLVAGESVGVPVTVSVPSDAVSGTIAYVELTAGSQVNPALQRAVSNTTIVNWNPGVLFAPEFSEQVDPGTVIAYVHTLTNTGNATDTFNIAYNSSAGWAVVTPTLFSDMGPGVEGTVWISVTVPPTSPGGLVETTIVTASSPESGVWAVVVDTTGVNHTPGDRYVATTGSDALNNCLVSTYPCRTVVQGVNQAATGDTVKVAAGTYSEHDVILNKNITLRGGYVVPFTDPPDPDVNVTRLDAQGLGRVLYIFGSPTVEGVTLQGGSTSGSGGGVYVEAGAPVVQRSAIVNNSASVYGGGIYVGLGTAIIRQNVITGNTAGVRGGGLYNYQESPTLERNLLAFNTAQQGGGFANRTGSPNFWNNLVYRNSASADGGGVYVAGGSPRVWHVTVYSNTADRGGGLYLAGGSPLVSNTIVVSNSASVAGGGVYSQAGGAALDYNDVWSNAGGDYAGLSAGSHSTFTNPLFLSAATYDLRLQGDPDRSPLVDQGDSGPLDEDYWGDPRPLGGPDIGADEVVLAGVVLAPDNSAGDTPGQTVIYNHTVTNTGPYTDTFVFSAQSDQGWAVTSPGSVELGPGLATGVQVEVQIAAGALSDTVDTTTVTATSTLNNAVFDTVVDVTTVGLARDVLLEPPRSRFVDSAPPSTVDVVYTHLLTNTTNYTDTFDLLWTSDQGLTVALDPTVVTLGAGAETTVYVTVTVPAIPTDTVLVDTTIITAVSQSAPSVFDPVTDTTYVNLDFGVELAPDREGSEKPGQTIWYNHTLTNTGNYSGTFIFTAQSSRGWNVYLPGPTEVGAGQATTVTVGVQIPAGTLSDTVDRTVVTATSQFSAAVSASVVETTTVAQNPDVWVERAWLWPGWCVPHSILPYTVPHQFRVENWGNLTDTFDITGTSSSGWPVIVSPTVVTLAPGAFDFVMVNTLVPSITYAITDTVVATATSRADGTVSDSHYYADCVGCEAYVELGPDNSHTVFLEEFVVYTHILTYTGQVDNLIQLSAQSSQGWPVTVYPGTVDVTPSATVMVWVTLTIPAGVVSGTDTTTVLAETTQYCYDYDSASDVTTVARPDVTLDPDRSQSAVAGGVMIYTHVLSNSGTVTDTYTLTYTDNLGWVNAVTPTVVYTLPPGAQVPVTATITVPPTGTQVLSGTMDVLVITATSSITDVICDTATDRTTMPYVPGATLAPDRSGRAMPGETVTYTHVLTNSGNYTESFDMTTHSEFGYSAVSPPQITDLGPGEAYTLVVATVQIPVHAPAEEIEETEVIASFVSVARQVVANDSTIVSQTVGTRYVALGGIDEYNNCTVPDGQGPCATIEHAVDEATAGDEVHVAQGVYTDVHVTGALTQVVYLDKSVALHGGYTTTNSWAAPDPAVYPTVLDAGAQGRVIYVAGGFAPTLEGLHLRGGSVSGDGAGVYIAGGALPTVRANLIYSNTAGGSTGSGGGVYYAGTGSPLLERNTVYGNTGVYGGGFYLASGSSKVWNNVFYHNTAGDLGGALYLGGNPTVWHNTIYSNVAGTSGWGGGIYVVGGAPSISNTIVADNARVGLYDLGGNSALVYSLVWGNSPDNLFNVNPGSGTITATPGFVNAPGADLHLRGDSPAINAGDPDGTEPAEDRDGNSRPLLGSRHDIGAYEYALMSAKTAVTTAVPGAIVTYTIAVTNVGDAIVENVPLSDTLHNYLAYAGPVACSPGSCGYVAGTRTITWTGPVYTATPSLITFTAGITGWLVAGTPITNVAWVNYTSTAVVTTVVAETPGARHVAMTGGDSRQGAGNNCLLPGLPCRTIQHAVGQALSGDAVQAATGVYTDMLGAGQVVSITKAITLSGGYTSTTWAHDPASYATTLDAQGGLGVIITGTNPAALAGLRIVGGSEGVAIYTATAVISRCRFYSNTDGVRAVGSSLTLERTWVYSNTGHGLDLEGGDYVLDNSVIAHNEGAGLQTASSAGTLRHNTFARNSTAGVVVSGTAGFTNTIFYSHTVGLSVTADSSAYLSNTIWYSNAANLGPGSLISSANVYSAPLFVDPDSVDYHIQLGSSAIDAGIETGLSVDVDGEPRWLMAHPDIGADEFSLEVTKWVTSSAAPGQTITYVITLEGEESGMVLTDTLDTVRLVDAATGDSVECNVGTCGYLAGSHAVTWTGSITMGQVVHITYTAQITDWLAAGVQVVNTADVQVEDEVLHTALVATTISGLPGTRYVAPAPAGDDTENNCRVDWKPCATVQQAVDQAQADDTVKVAMGTYTGTAGNVVSIAKALTVQGGYVSGAWSTPDPLAYPTILDGEGSRRVVYITGTMPVTVAGFHVVSGTATAGGGVYVYTATVTLADSQVYSNVASGSGGGIYQQYGSFTLVNSQIYSNSTNGSGRSGGGVFLNNVQAALTGNRIYTNTATGYGGGVCISGTSSAVLVQNLVLDNQAGQSGGGVSVESNGFVTLTNSIIAANRSDQGGGGLYFASAGTGYLRHTTIADNGGEGLRVGSFTVFMTNTVLAGHTVGITASGSVTADHTLWDGSGTYTGASGGGSIVTTNDLTGAPRFANPAGLDYHVAGDSAAVGAGTWIGVAEDVDGDTRFPSLVDVGADQYPLRLSRWVNPISAPPCGVVTHTLALANLRSGLLPGVQLTDTLDANAGFAGSITATVGSATYAAGSHVILWTDNVPADGVVITYTARITPCLINGTLLSHTATLSDSISIFDTPPATASVATLPATLGKSAPLTVTLGQAVSYTINFTLPVGHVAYAPVLVDILPRLVTGSGISDTPALTYVVGSAAPFTPTVSADGTLTWTLSTVTATCDTPEVVTITFAARVRNLDDNDVGDVLTNTVALSYTETTASGPAHVITTTQVSVLGEPDLVAAKAMLPTADLGALDTVGVTVTLTNSGTSGLYDIVLTDTLPAELIVLDGPPGYGVSGRVVTWTVSSLEASQQEVYTITAQVTATIGAGQSLTNTLEVWGSSLPGVVAEEQVYTGTAQATATTGYPDLLIGKDGPAVRSPGQMISYTIAYTNTGVVRAEGVHITDTLPLSLTGVISTSSASATVEHAGQTVTWTLTAPVSRSISGRVWVTATVSLAAQAGDVLRNTVGITTTLTAEPASVGNADFVTTSVQLPSLSITKTAAPTPVLPDALLVYTLTISNSGLGDATGLLISDTVPLSTTYQSCSGGDSCGYHSGSGVVTWTLTTLPSSEQAQVGFTVRVDADVGYGNTIDNATYSASCIQGEDATGTGVSALVDVVRDLSLLPSSQQQSVLLGGQAVYSHTLTNLGNMAWTFDLTVSSPPSGWTYDLQPTQVVNLAPSASAAVALTVTAPSSGLALAVATIQATWQGVPGVYATAVDTTTIDCQAVSGASIVYSPMAPQIGQTITFTGSVGGGTPPLSYTWDFDGGTGSGQVVTHAYSDDRSYTVRLTVVNCGGASSVMTQQNVVVSPYLIYLPVILRNG